MAGRFRARRGTLLLEVAMATFVIAVAMAVYTGMVVRRSIALRDAETQERMLALCEAELARAAAQPFARIAELDGESFPVPGLSGENGENGDTGGRLAVLTSADPDTLVVVARVEWPSARGHPRVTELSTLCSRWGRGGSE